MPIEIEAKLKVHDHEGVRRRLEALGAERLAVRRETNTFFDTEDRSLLAADQGLRIRTNRDEATGAETHIITHKGPRQHGPLKRREESELTVAGADDARVLLGRLGFVVVLCFEKRREVWWLDGCEVELDELPLLGRFVEIEGPDEATVESVRRKLELAGTPVVKASYVALLMAYLQEHGRSERVVRLEEEGAGAGAGKL